jgi:SAM-dependent methyltransferase
VTHRLRVRAVSVSSGHDLDQPTPTTASDTTPHVADDSGPIDPIELYAAGVDTSDYVAHVAPLIRQGVGEIGDLLDIGAGGGQIGAALRAPQRRWTAVEPSSNMRARLARLSAPPLVIAEGWELADLPIRGHDTVLAANIAAPLQEPNAFLARCLSWSRRSVVWVVPAQHGPHGLCFAGCLPAAWHGEDETPGVDLVLRGLAPSAQPHALAVAEWTFSGIVADVAELAAYLADRLGWPPSRRSEMTAHLARQAKPDPRGYRLEIPRKSAILIWTCQEGGVHG